MKINNLLAIFCLLSLVGCVTAYQPYGMMGGYTSKWVKDDVLEVTVKGNAVTGQDRLTDYARLQAADVAKNAGYNYFGYTQITKKTDKHGQSYLRPSVISGTWMGGYPMQIATFRMYRIVPEGVRPGQYFIVSEVQSELRAKYNIR